MNTVVKSGVLPGSGKRPDEQCVYVKNLPPDTTDQCLYELFCPFGAIAPRGVKAMLKEDGTCNSVGFVDFQDPISAAARAARAWRRRGPRPASTLTWARCCERRGRAA